MILSPFEPLPKFKLATVKRPVGDCTLFKKYQPKPGGQTLLWEEFVTFGNADRSQPLDLDYRGLYVKGGRGGGKSHIGAAIACSRAYFDPKSRGLISANEYGQLETSTLVALAEFCDQFQIPLEPKGSSAEETASIIARRRRCTIFEAPVLVLASSKFGGDTAKTKQGGRGIQCRWAWLDEWATADKIAMDVLNAALGRGKGILKGFFWITSTINLSTPYNWCWEMFDDPDRSTEKRENYRTITLRSADNDSLPDDFVKTLMASYTPEMVAIELLGEYAVSKDGLAINHFSRVKHVPTAPISIDPKAPLHISSDFNRQPCSSIIGQVQGNRIIVLAEIHIIQGDTFALADALVLKLNEFLPLLTPNDLQATVHVHGDASGKILTANSQLSNWQIIWKALHKIPNVNFKRRYKEANPPVIDTINSLNVLTYQDRLQINPMCKELIKDLETCKLLKQPSGRMEIDKKSDPKRSHFLDCLRYLSFDEFPIRLKSPVDHIKSGKLETEDSSPDWEQVFSGF